MQLRKATRKQAKLRIGLSAPSGFGKTYSGLLMAYGITGDWEKIAVIDTENGSGELYSHLGDYNALPLEAPYSPERYIQAIKACEEAGMEVIIIDSISHEWEGKGGCLEIQEKLGGKYQDWAKVTPRHQAFIEAILTSKCHIITTVRRKQDYSMVQEGNKTKVEKTGLKEVTRDGFEYELTVNLNIINDKHLVQASKDRTGLFMDKPEFIITEETGKKLKEWAETGIDVAAFEAAEKEKAQAVAEALAIELDDKKKELFALVEDNLECFGTAGAEASKKLIEGMTLALYDSYKERIVKKVEFCQNERLSKAEEIHDLVTTNSDALGDDVVAHYLQICADANLEAVRKAYTSLKENQVLLATVEEPVSTPNANAKQKEKIIALLNNPVITRQEKTKELLRINQHSEEDATKIIEKYTQLIEEREQETSPAA